MWPQVCHYSPIGRQWQCPTAQTLVRTQWDSACKTQKTVSIDIQRSNTPRPNPISDLFLRPASLSNMGSKSLKWGLQCGGVEKKPKACIGRDARFSLVFGTHTAVVLPPWKPLQCTGCDLQKRSWIRVTFRLLRKDLKSGHIWESGRSYGREEVGRRQTDETLLATHCPPSPNRWVHFKDLRTVILSNLTLWNCSSLYHSCPRLLRSHHLRMSEVQDLKI